MVASVLAVTLFVGTEKLTDELPASTVAEAGGKAAVELLERLMTAPPAGAWPFSIRTAPACAPPLMEVGLMMSDLSEGGIRLNCAVAVPELSVAVIVTGVGETTCPAVIWNCVNAVLPGMVTVVGTGTAVGFELVRLITVPAAGAAPESCS